MENIILIGMPSSGKTTVANLLHETTKIKVVDTDDLIVSTCHMSIKNIFSIKGEEYFRCVEKDICRSLCKYEGYIISTGGGMPVFNDNIDYLNSLGTTIYLKVTPKVILNRNKEGRPLLNGLDEKKILELLQKREPYYNKAKLCIDNSKITENECRDLIIDLIFHKENNNFSNIICK